MKRVPAPVLFLPVLSFFLALSGCGPIEKPGISGKIKANYQPPAQMVVDLQKFSSDCSAKGGVLMANNTVCATMASSSIPGSNGSLQDITLTQSFASGMALRTSGTGAENLVQVYVNGNLVSNVPAGFTSIPQSGVLHVIAQPGSWSNVTIMVYTCYNGLMQQMACPAL